jgi:cytochrome b subunit of formate dehydrogenase
MEEEFERFNLFQIVQHLAWLWAFLVLAATGLSFKFAYSPVSQFYVQVIGGYETRALIHRTAAGFWIGVALIHGFYYIFIDRGPKPILPNRGDLSDFTAHIRYLLGRGAEKPSFGRYSWYEKFEYWAGGAGFLVMATTGLMMWLKYDLTMKYLPLAVINIIRRVHGWEALLAVLFLSVFHVYINVWRPGVFPMAGHVISGMVSRSSMEDEHPKELEEILKSRE